MCETTRYWIIFTKAAKYCRFCYLVLDEKGGKIKSEAAILVKTNSLIIADENKPRHFDFDKPYVMFLVDEGKNDPYFALRVKDLKGLQ